jgi:hypothetical protein
MTHSIATPKEINMTDPYERLRRRNDPLTINTRHGLYRRAHQRVTVPASRLMRVGAFLIALLLLGLIALFIDGQRPAKLDGSIIARCTEDMVCWDCETMGNKVCGPVIEP